MAMPAILSAIMPPSRLSQYSAKWRGSKCQATLLKRDLGKPLSLCTLRKDLASFMAVNLEPKDWFTLIVRPLRVVTRFCLLAGLLDRLVGFRGRLLAIDYF